MNVNAYEKEADIKHHFYFINFTDMKSANYRFAGEHIHHSIEIIFCYNGKIKAEINKKTIFIEKGDLLIINPLDFHFYEYVDNASCFILVISDDYFNDIIDITHQEFVNKLTFNEIETNELLSLLVDAYKDFDSMSFISKKSFVLNFFSKIEKKDFLRNKEKINDREVCKNIISFVEENYMNKLSISTIASYFGYSKNYFSHLFNSLVGENFNTFVNRYRVKMVNIMKKENPKMLVEDIIVKCGFSSRETYYRFIRKH